MDVDEDVDENVEHNARKPYFIPWDPPTMSCLVPLYETASYEEAKVDEDMWANSTSREIRNICVTHAQHTFDVLTQA